MKKLPFYLLLALGFAACASDATQPVETTPTEEVFDGTGEPTSSEAEVAGDEGVVLIADGSFAGLKLNTAVADADDRLSAGQLSTASGSENVYWIDGSGPSESVAYATVDAEQRIQSITIIEPDITTAAGIGVGSNYSDVKRAYPGIKAAQSAAGQFFATTGGLHFKLSGLDDDATVEEILLRS